MAIDTHAHYIPARMVERLREEGGRLGISVVDQAQGCPCLHFGYGLKVRPFFTKLVESPEARIESMLKQGVERQIVGGWVDVFGHGLPAEQGGAWHRLMNESLAETCHAHPAHFSMLASGHLPDAAGAARELEHAVRQLGAVGAIAACNVEGVNLGELPLDEYWAAAQELDVPVFLHPTQAMPTPRTKAFALNQVVQYTFDSTLCMGSLMWGGVLDRFPRLQLIMSHGGGALPYLMGRFDCMDQRSDPHHTGIVSTRAPSVYAKRLHYDTILHNPAALRYLAQEVGVERLLLGTDDGFPPADRDPLASLKNAGFGADEVRRIADENPRRLFRV